MSTDQNLKDAVKNLFLAAQHGRVDVLKGLIAHCQTEENSIAFEEMRDERGQTPLHMAVKYEKVDAIRYLLSIEFPSNLRTFDTCVSPYEEILNQLKTHQQKKWHQMKQVFHEFLLHQIVMDNRLTVQCLVEGGIDVGIREAVEGLKPRNQSFYHWAASSGSVETMKFFLSLDFNAEILQEKNENGNTPLDEAKKNRHQQLVQLLDRKKISEEIESLEAILIEGHYEVDRWKNSNPLICCYIERLENENRELKKALEEKKSSPKEKTQLNGRFKSPPSPSPSSSSSSSSSNRTHILYVSHNKSTAFSTISSWSFHQKKLPFPHHFIKEEYEIV